MAQVKGHGRVEKTRRAAELDVEVGTDGHRGRYAILDEQEGEGGLALLWIPCSQPNTCRPRCAGGRPCRSEHLSGLCFDGGHVITTATAQSLRNDSDPSRNVLARRAILRKAHQIGSVYRFRRSQTEPCPAAETAPANRSPPSALLSYESATGTVRPA